jgi:hypothetical protein
MLDFVAGFLSAWILRSLLQRRLSRRGGNMGATPLVCNEGRTVRGNGNGGPTTPKPPIKPQFPPPRQIREDFLPPPAPERWATMTVQGLNWPETLGDFALVGSVNNQGACRWYERRHDDGTTEHIEVDHNLQPIKSMTTNPSITPQPEPVTPTDEEIMELMPQKMRDDLAATARAVACGLAITGFERDSSMKSAGAWRIIFNRHAVDHARAVLAKWGHTRQHY